MVKNQKKSVNENSKKHNNDKNKQISANRFDRQYVPINQDILENAMISNHTGIPSLIKSKFESNSGVLLDDVRVHYNSNNPDKINALAYTKGNQIYIGQGQEKYLKHELVHVVQQKQGIVRPTSKINGIPINDSLLFEQQAEQMLLRNTIQVNPSYNRQQEPVIQAAKENNEYYNNKFKQIEANHNSEDKNFEKLKISLDNKYKIGFIINVMTAYNNIENMDDIFSKMIGDFDKSRVAIVLDINSKKGENTTPNYKEAIEKVKECINSQPIPIAIVESTYNSKDFPFGTIRNDLLESNATKKLANYFFENKLYPYISIQDFDNSSRNVKDRTLPEKHIFDVISEKLSAENVLSKKDIDTLCKSQYKIFDLLKNVSVLDKDWYNETIKYFAHKYNDKIKNKDFPASFPLERFEELNKISIEDKNFLNTLNDRIKKDFWKIIVKVAIYRKTTNLISALIKKLHIKVELKQKNGSRPLLLGGGYRLSSFEKTKEILKKRFENEPENIEAIFTEPLYNDFCKYFLFCMKFRNRMYKSFPLLPYAPEPNLFIDAFVALDEKVKFGDNKAEYLKLRRSVFNYQERERIDNISELRNCSYDFDFNYMSVETDLSRIIKNAIKENKFSQDDNAGTILDNVAKDKKSKKDIHFAEKTEKFKPLKYNIIKNKQLLSTDKLRRYFNKSSVKDEKINATGDSNISNNTFFDDNIIDIDKINEVIYTYHLGQKALNSLKLKLLSIPEKFLTEILIEILIEIPKVLVFSDQALDSLLNEFDNKMKEELPNKYSKNIQKNIQKKFPNETPKEILKDLNAYIMEFMKAAVNQDKTENQDNSRETILEYLKLQKAEYKEVQKTLNKLLLDVSYYINEITEIKNSIAARLPKDLKRTANESTANESTASKRLKPSIDHPRLESLRSRTCKKNKSYIN